MTEWQQATSELSAKDQPTVYGVEVAIQTQSARQGSQLSQQSICTPSVYPTDDNRPNLLNQPSSQTARAFNQQAEEQMEA